MGFFSEKIIKEVQSKADIVEIVSEYTSLQNRGKNYLGLCPFHKEKTPSFNVDVEKQLFYCFGCGIGGNVFTFIMNKENFSFPEAVRYLADKYNIVLHGKMDKELSKEFLERRKYFKINRLVAKYFDYCLFKTHEGSRALAYLKKRGFDIDIMKKFHLGYALPSWDDLIKFARKKDIGIATLEKTGLVMPRKDSKGHYDRFRNRVIFPITDVTGNIIGFGGRALDETMPKYLNSPETPLFSKGDNLYALSMIKKDPTFSVIVVEGYMDCISLYQSGFRQVVASLGTALTKRQAILLKRYTNEVILSYDADEAGKAAALRGMNVLAQEGLRVKILSLPDGKDPDDVIKDRGPEYFQRLLDTSMSFTSYKLHLAKQDTDVDTANGKLKFIKQAVDILAEVNNEPELEVLVGKLSNELGVSTHAIKREVEKIKLGNNGFRYKKSHIRNNNKEFDKIPPITGFDRAERKFLKLIIENHEILQKFKDQINPHFFTNINTRKIADILFRMFEEKQDVDVSHMFNCLDEEACAELSTIIMGHIELKDEGLINELVRKIKQGYFKKSIADVRKQIQKAEILGQREEINDLLITYQQLKTEMNKLNNHAHISPGKEGA